jgi:hypothetical protein
MQKIGNLLRGNSQIDASTAPQPPQPDSRCLRNCVLTARLCVVGIVVGVVLLCFVTIPLGISLSIVAIFGIGLLLAILFYKNRRKAALEASGDPSPQVRSQEQEIPPSDDNSPGAELEPAFCGSIPPDISPIDPLPMQKWNFLLPADSVREERAQNIAEELLACGDPEGAERWLYLYGHEGIGEDHVGTIQVFLALKKLNSDFADKVFAAATSGQEEPSPILLLGKFLSSDERERNNAIITWSQMDNHVDQAQVYECVKSNLSLAKQMQDRMKGDKFFELYLRVTATAVGDPEAAVVMADGPAILSDIGAEILRCLPSKVAARIFASMPSSQGADGDEQWRIVNDNFSDLLPWLLCGMAPAEAAKLLSRLSGYELKGIDCHRNLLEEFISFMRLNPRAAANVLAHMPEGVIQSIFNEHKCKFAMIDRIRPFLTEFNKGLAERLFSSPYSYGNSTKSNTAKLLAMDPKDVVSALKDPANDLRIFTRMIYGSSPEQKKKIVQILVALLRGSLLNNEELGTWLRSLIVTCERGSCDWNKWDKHAWLLTFVEDFPDEMLAKLVCQMDAKSQEKLLAILPTECRKKVQNLIAAPETEDLA